MERVKVKVLFTERLVAVKTDWLTSKDLKNKPDENLCKSAGKKKVNAFNNEDLLDITNKENW